MAESKTIKTIPIRESFSINGSDDIVKSGDIKHEARLLLTSRTPSDASITKGEAVRLGDFLQNDPSAEGNVGCPVIDELLAKGGEDIGCPVTDETIANKENDGCSERDELVAKVEEDIGCPVTDEMVANKENDGCSERDKLIDKGEEDIGCPVTDELVANGEENVGTKPSTNDVKIIIDNSALPTFCPYRPNSCNHVFFKIEITAFRLVWMVFIAVFIAVAIFLAGLYSNNHSTSLPLTGAMCADLSFVDKRKVQCNSTTYPVNVPAGSPFIADEFGTNWLTPTSDLLVNVYCTFQGAVWVSLENKTDCKLPNRLCYRCFCGGVTGKWRHDLERLCTLHAVYAGIVLDDEI